LKWTATIHFEQLPHELLIVYVYLETDDSTFADSEPVSYLSDDGEVTAKVAGFSKFLREGLPSCACDGKYENQTRGTQLMHDNSSMNILYICIITKSYSSSRDEKDA